MNYSVDKLTATPVFLTLPIDGYTSQEITVDRPLPVDEREVVLKGTVSGTASSSTPVTANITAGFDSRVVAVVFEVISTTTSATTATFRVRYQTYDANGVPMAYTAEQTIASGVAVPANTASPVSYQYTVSPSDIVTFSAYADAAISVSVKITGIVVK